jgi:hypothetical protein
MLDPLALWPILQVFGQCARPWLARTSALLGVGSLARLSLYLMIAMILVMLVGLGFA